MLLPARGANVPDYVQEPSYVTVHGHAMTDFADASHSESAKSTTTTVLYGIFSSENSYPSTVTFILIKVQVLRESTCQVSMNPL